MVKTGDASAREIAQHIAHIAGLTGPEHVCLGSDFDGMNAYPVDMKNWSDVPNLFDELQRIGFSDKEIRRIAYDNLHDYIIQFVD